MTRSLLGNKKKVSPIIEFFELKTAKDKNKKWATIVDEINAHPEVYYEQVMKRKPVEKEFVREQKGKKK